MIHQLIIRIVMKTCILSQPYKTNNYKKQYVFSITKHKPLLWLKTPVNIIKA